MLLLNAFKLKYLVVNAFAILAFFPYFSFGVSADVVPLGAILLFFSCIAFSKFSIWIVVFLVSNALFFVLIPSLVTIVDLENSILFLYTICMLALCGQKRVAFVNPELIVKAASIIWFSSVVISNFDYIFSPISEIIGRFSNRSMTCDFPMTCIRGGSGLAPEPTYAAYAVIPLTLLSLSLKDRVGLRYLFFNLVTLVLLNNLFAWTFILIFFATFAAKYKSKETSLILLIFILGVISYTDIARLSAFSELIAASFRTQGASTDTLASQVVSRFGSTREVGVYCGLAEAEFFPQDHSVAERKFKDCQVRELGLLGHYRADFGEGGSKPYSPFAFTVLYFGYVAGLFLIFFLLAFIVRSITIYWVWLLIALAILIFRQTVSMPFIYLLFFILRNCEAAVGLAASCENTSLETSKREFAS